MIKDPSIQILLQILVFSQYRGRVFKYMYFLQLISSHSWFRTRQRDVNLKPLCTINARVTVDKILLKKPMGAVSVLQFAILAQTSPTFLTAKTTVGYLPVAYSLLIFVNTSLTQTVKTKRVRSPGQYHTPTALSIRSTGALNDSGMLQRRNRCFYFWMPVEHGRLLFTRLISSNHDQLVVWQVTGGGSI